ncbi:phenylalanine--tRNA ligase subunit beta [Catenulispora pinisilvae]|uniref:phenylalanine--tRNA ligase subunit beta n=1 Tax=Catenulispora pinisilvae TaxID=2705253 RepID=UPI0018922BDD|nr:phenylalanine--tRNA ligase subunit beta [Catenulispora pinisilvae]
MHVPYSWLQDYVALPDGTTAFAVADKLTQTGGGKLETIERVGEGLTGPLVVGKVAAIEELTGFKKPIRHCQVVVTAAAEGPGSAADPQLIVCGARNFAVGDHVVVALPGAVLPGDFRIAARKTYSRDSNGMICSAGELGMGDAVFDSKAGDGIIVLSPDSPVGADAIAYLGLDDEVIEFEVTPDRGYTLSLRGIAREAATGFDVPFQDPAAIQTPEANDSGYPVKIEDPAGCDVFVARTVTGIDPHAPSPLWMQRRLQMSGMRPISLIVDVANYVMLELGQPIHTYDRQRLSGPIVVRRARAGEVLETLDGGKRQLDPADLLITDDSGPIGLAGVMGGASTEIHDGSTEVVVEAAHFQATSIAKTVRRHKLPSEAAKRFERDADPGAAAAAAQRVVDLLVELAGGTAEPGVTVIGAVTRPAALTIPWTHPGRVAGVDYTREEVERRLHQVGCDLEASGDDDLVVTPPSWRADLRDPNDLAEEVIRLEGFDRLPATLPRASAGTGYTHAQRIRRRVGTALASAGYAEVIAYPFLGQADLDALGLPENDPRRITVPLANPISEEQPSMRTTLLPGLLAALRRNVGRGTADLALFEQGLVFHPRKDAAPVAPRLTVERRPTDEELASLDAALPRQPRRVAVVLSGLREPAGWWGPGRPAGWQDAIQAARIIADACRVELEISQDQHEPWHPGRCARLAVDGRLVGHAGELHPRVVAELGLPPRTAAMELELDRMIPAEEVLTQAPAISSMPVATQDVALVVDAMVPEHDVEAALREGAGALLESVRLFDVYTGERIGEGRKSLAFALRFRAPDRTLTAEEASQARDSAVELAASRTGAVLRS